MFFAHGIESLHRILKMEREARKGQMVNGKWVRGGRAKGMESALSSLQGRPGRGGQLAAASRRERFRACSCCASLRLSEELAEQWVVQLVAPSSCADQHAFLNEARAMLSVDFSCEVMRWNIAFGEACELLSEPQFFGTQLGNISPEFLATQLIEYRGPNRFEFV